MSDDDDDGGGGDDDDGGGDDDDGGGDDDDDEQRSLLWVMASEDEVMTSHRTWRELTDCCFHHVTHQVSQWSRRETFVSLLRSAGSRN